MSLSVTDLTEPADCDSINSLIKVEDPPGVWGESAIWVPLFLCVCLVSHKVADMLGDCSGCISQYVIFFNILCTFLTKST